MAQITLAGNPVEVQGTFPQVGDLVPNIGFTANDLTDLSLSDFAGKRKILNIFPSIDTGICATSVRKFNQQAANLSNTVVLCLSADLPFAQTRFCGAEGIENVQTLSTFRHQASHQALGVAMKTEALAGLTARAVIVLDEQNRVLHSELVPEIKQEPNYDLALNALA